MGPSSEAVLLGRIVAIQGLIEAAPDNAARKVFPRGDKRKRPAFWLTCEDFTRLERSGVLQETPRGFVVKDEVSRRMRRGVSGQHSDTEERDVYLPDGSLRKAAFNTRSSALERLARKRGRDGRLILNAAEIEAGRRLAQDYARAGYGDIRTQNFESPSVDGGDRNGATEKRLLASMTAKTRYLAARHALGEGLESAVVAVCCRDEDLSAVERAENWAKASGLSILKIGSSRLVTLYGTNA